MARSCSEPNEPCGDAVAVAGMHLGLAGVTICYILATVLVVWRRNRAPISLRPWPLTLLACFGAWSNFTNTWFWAAFGTTCTPWSMLWGWLNVHLFGAPVVVMGLRLWLKHIGERQKLLVYKVSSARSFFSTARA